MKITLLGCGGAPGVPSISRGWGSCDPNESRNRRLRSSILLEENATAILVDTGPDLREQLLRAEVKRLDAILYTHAHADHTHGIDEIREINRLMRAPIAVWGMESTLLALKERFSYAFEDVDTEKEPDAIIFRPWLCPHVVDCPHPRPFAVNGIKIRPFVQDHGWDISLGFRFGDFAYSTDVQALDEEAFAVLAGVRVWVVGCLTEIHHVTHANLATVQAWTERLKPERVILTHMGISMDYRSLREKLQNRIEPGFDGMVIET